MDSSDNYFTWQTTSVSNGTEPQLIANSMDGFMQQQQQQAISQADSENSPKQSPLTQTTVSSPQQSVYVHGSESSNASPLVEKKDDEASDSILPVDLVNPDAIEPKARSYTCRICQVTFPNKSAVTVHSRLHTDHQGKPYRCNFCGKGFSTNFYLKQHERIHSGQKPYKCPMCDNSFKQLSHVQQHVRTHTGVRPYKCHWPGCGKAFLQQSHLKSHEARHVPKPTTGARPFKCHWPDCGKSFAQLSNLKSHVARHTPGKSKSRKPSSNSNASKKTESPAEEDSNGALNFQNVINQAAAAANIVPTAADDEAEIRPYLCPGCSKLYVREATFKKHLEECKTKLQMSISATASALGIEPPPIPSSSSVLTEYDPGLIQVVDVNSQQQEGEPAKRPRIDVKSEDGPGVIVQQQSDVQDAVVSMNSVLVKQEPVTSSSRETVSFVSRQAISQESVYKLPQIVDSSSTASSSAIYSVQSSAHQQPNQIPVDNVIFQIGGAESGGKQQVQHHLVGAQGQNIILSAADLRVHPGQPLVENLSQAPTILLAQPQPVTSSPSMSKDSDQDHSTINQAAIRWQWDQSSVPRLNFP